MKDEMRYTKVPLPIACSSPEPALAERRRELTGDIFGGPILLRVQGPEGTKEFVKVELVEPGREPHETNAEPVGA